MNRPGKQQFGDDIITVLLVDDIPETRENVKKLLAFEPDFKVIGSVGTGREGVTMAKELKPNIIIMDINMPDMDGIQATTIITGAVPTSAVIMMSVQNDPKYLRLAMIAGARNFLTKPILPDELYNTIRGVHVRNKPIAAQYTAIAAQEPTDIGKSARANGTENRAGLIIVVYSPQGGVGCTTIATNLASVLMKEGIRVLLVDADLQFGDVGVFLNLQSQSTMVDLVGNVDDLDTELFDNIVVTHDSGLKVLMGPARPEFAEVIQANPTSVAQILQKIAGNYDFIIVDTGRHLDETLLSLFDDASKIILVAIPTLASVKNARFVLDLFDQLTYAPEKTMLVLNQCGSDNKVDLKYLVNTEKIAKFLKKPIDIEIPFRRGEILSSIAKGIPLTNQPKLANDSIGTQIIRLSTKLHQVFGKQEAEMPVHTNQKAVGLKFGKQADTEAKSIINELEFTQLRIEHFIASEKLRLAHINPLYLHVVERLYKVAFSAAHDMRSPLGIALDFIDITIKKGKKNPDLVDLSNRIKLCLQEANNFLNISLFEEAGSEKQDALQILYQLTSWATHVGDLSIKIKPSSTLFVDGRRTQIQLLTFNLLMIVFRWPGISAPTSVTLDGNSVHLHVSAISPEDLEPERLGTLGAISTVDRTGSRFYIINQILRQLGGQLSIKSSDQFTELVVTLPSVDEKDKFSNSYLVQLQSETAHFEDEINMLLADKISTAQDALINETYIAIVTGFYREISEHLKAAKTKLEMLVGGDQNEVLHKVSRNIRYCELLIRNVMLTATGIEIKHQEVNVYDILVDTVELLERKANLAHIELYVDVPEALTIETDIMAFQQIVMNLGRNAIDAIKREGSILFHAHLVDNYVQIDVVDTGPGIPEEIQDQVFRLGFSTKTGGYGIGLHSVRSIIERLNGTIDFQTESGIGTVMHIEIPVRSER